MNIDFIDRFKKEELTQSGFWSLNKKIGAIIAAVLFTVILINTTGCTQNQAVEETIIVNEETPQDTINVVNDGENASIASDEDGVVIMSGNQSSAMVAMSVEDTGRSDPFLPAGESVSLKPQNSLNFELLPPPEAITTDETAAEVMTTKVSGIMYDNYNPSAILNISNSDYLVRTGDIVNGYKVLSIGREYVTVQHGANVYKAGVGELFTDDGIKFNTISNLESKFGGRKNAANR